MRTLILSVLMASLCCTQGLDTRPAFEAASLKPSSDNFRTFGGPGTADPGRWTCTYTLDNLVLKAYNIRPYQLSALAWMASSRFTMVAKLPDGTTMEQFRLMQQRVLEERFHIVFHREKKEMSVYEMTVLPGGPKVTEYVEPATAGESGPPVPPTGTDSDGYPVIRGGSGFMRLPNGRAGAQFKQQTMDNLAFLIGGQLGRPVIDATGLKGKYALTLSWFMEPMVAAPQPPPISGENGVTRASDPGIGGPTIFRAVQDQLGLKLEAKKGIIDMLVIDRAEKVPVEN